MRDYGKVSALFWTGNTGREIRKRGQAAQLAALYLVTAPGSNMLGVYHLPVATLGHAITETLEGASKALRSLSEVGYCTYDDESEWVWVHEMARYQIDEQLDPRDNRVKSVAKEWLALPELPFLAQFFERYAQDFHLPQRKPVRRPLKAPSESLRSQEQEQEQEQTATSPIPGTPGSVSAGTLPGIPPPAEARKQRIRQIATDAIETFNASPITKRNGGRIANVQLLTDERIREVERCLRIAQQICQQRSGSSVVTREFWVAYWESCNVDEFFSGRAGGGKDHANWRPDFEFLTRRDTMGKVFDRAMSEAEEVEHVNP